MRDGPFSTMRWAVWRTRSQIVLAMLGSWRCSCHFAGGTPRAFGFTRTDTHRRKPALVADVHPMLHRSPSPDWSARALWTLQRIPAKSGAGEPEPPRSPDRAPEAAA